MAFAVASATKLPLAVMTLELSILIVAREVEMATPAIKARFSMPASAPRAALVSLPPIPESP